MQKFHRNYKATFEIYDIQNRDFTLVKVVTIENPITCHFNIDMDVAGQASLATFQFINLSDDIRAYLWKDLYVTDNSELKYIKMSFEAGYGNPQDKSHNFVQALVYKGIVQVCNSHKPEGGTDWITEVQVAPNDIYQYAFANSTFKKGTPIEDVLNYLLTSTNTNLGYVTDELPDLTRNKTFIGQFMDLINREFSGYEVFVDKGKFNILGENDVIPGNIMVITDASGLLGTPKRAMQYVEVDMLFEPQLTIGQAITLESKLMPQFNQLYKVMAINHQGVISDRESGKLITRVTLFAVSEKTKIKTLKPAKVAKYTGKATTKWTKPVQGKLTSPFGWRIHPIDNVKKYHDGIDIGTSANTPIYAPADGTVIFVGWKGGYGNYVALDNGEVNSIKLSSGFGHMNSTNVRVGQKVYKGQTILGRVGSTGNSTGPHLHMEVRENGKLVDAQKYVGKY